MVSRGLSRAPRIMADRADWYRPKSAHQSRTSNINPKKLSLILSLLANLSPQAGITPALINSLYHWFVTTSVKNKQPFHPRIPRSI